jgi:CRP-like cAMP-binding protein
MIRKKEAERFINMHVFEKMLFLKSLPLFQFVKEDSLLELASNLEMQLVQPGTVIIKKGDFDTTMYMIVSGKIKIHDEAHTMAEFTDHEVFGELAALSPEKRIASVTALEETLLLKIGQTTLYDLMETDIEIAKGIIEVLCRRIRKMAADAIPKA